VAPTARRSPISDRRSRCQIHHADRRMSQLGNDRLYLLRDPGR
jgi:hypothetical protein